MSRLVVSTGAEDVDTRLPELAARGLGAKPSTRLGAMAAVIVFGQVPTGGPLDEDRK